MLHWMCSFYQLLGGRTSMATQQTHRELAPKYAAGKVLVPWGRKCHWETRRLLLWSRRRSFGGVVVLVFCPLQQQSYAMSVCKNANWTGLTLSMPPSCRCQAKLASQASLDFQSWMIPRDSIFPPLVANNPASTKNARRHAMWQLLFVTSWFVNFSNDCTFLTWNVALNLQLLGGRTSMATQQTHRELAPKYAAGKVPVPWGRKCHWETRRPLLWSRQRSFGGVVVLVFGPLQQQSYAMSVCKNANWTGLTLSMPPSCRCQAKLASQASLDFQSWMIPRDSIFPPLVANNPASTKNASRHAMWQLLFVTLNSSTSAIPFVNSCLYVSDLECCIECAAFISFWGAGQAWPRSKHTGSLLPNTLRGKSPCLGAESGTGRPEDLYSGAVLLVSQWHFLPQGTGTFPAAYLGASSLCVCCVAMLVLPPKSCKFNATFQVRNVQSLLKLTNQDVTNRSCHIACRLAFFVEAGLFATKGGKMLSRGIIQDWKSRLACDASFAWHLQEGGMERVSPVQLAFLQTLMA